MVETEVQNEIILNVPLRKAKLSSRSRRADSAVNVLKTFVSKNTKTEMSKIWIDTTVNNRIWETWRMKWEKCQHCLNPLNGDFRNLVIN